MKVAIAPAHCALVLSVPPEPAAPVDVTMRSKA